MADKDDTDFDTVSKMADRLKLTGADREDYVHKHMRGLGYKSKRTYYREDKSDESGGFFGRSKRNRDDDDDDLD